jgi:hypothetical protein
MQHDSQNPHDDAPGLRSKCRELLDMINSIEQNEDAPANAEPKEEEILV